MRNEDGWEPQIIFIEADDQMLVSRYKESRRPHPAAENGDILSTIRAERRDLFGLREVAALENASPATATSKSGTKLPQLIECQS